MPREGFGHVRTLRGLRGWDLLDGAPELLLIDGAAAVGVELAKDGKPHANLQEADQHVDAHIKTCATLGVSFMRPAACPPPALCPQAWCKFGLPGHRLSVTHHPPSHPKALYIVHSVAPPSVPSHLPPPVLCSPHPLMICQPPNRAAYLVRLAGQLPAPAALVGRERRFALRRRRPLRVHCVVSQSPLAPPEAHGLRRRMVSNRGQEGAGGQEGV